MSLLRRRMMMQEWEEVDDNLINMEEYNNTVSRNYSQYFDVDLSKTYYMYGYAYFNCFSKWGANIGMGNTDEDGKVNFVDGTVKIFAYFPAGGNPYFGLTKRS